MVSQGFDVARRRHARNYGDVVELERRRSDAQVSDPDDNCGIRSGVQHGRRNRGDAGSDHVRGDDTHIINRDVVAVANRLFLGARAKTKAADDGNIANRNIVIHHVRSVDDVQRAVGVQFHLHRHEDRGVVGAGGIGAKPVKSFRQNPVAALLDNNSRSIPGNIPLGGPRRARGGRLRVVGIEGDRQSRGRAACLPEKRVIVVLGEHEAEPLCGIFGAAPHPHLESRGERLHPASRVDFREDIGCLQGKARRLENSKFIKDILQVDQRKLRIRQERHDARTVDVARPTGIRGEVRLKGARLRESGCGQGERGNHLHEKRSDGMI